MPGDNLIEQLIHNLPIKEGKLETLSIELDKTCEDINPKCGDACPVFRLNGSKILIGDPDNENICIAHRKPQVMYDFIKENHLKKVKTNI